MVAIERQLPVDGETVADAIPLRLRRTGGSPRQVFVLCLVGAVALAVFASRDLVSWLDRMGGGPAVQPIQQAAAAWDGAMAQLGLVRPHEALRATIRDLLDRQW